MTHSSVTQKCPYSRHSGPVGCLPAPNIFRLANEFAKGKMFWNSLTFENLILPSFFVCILGVLMVALVFPYHSGVILLCR